MRRFLLLVAIPGALACQSSAPAADMLPRLRELAPSSTVTRTPTSAHVSTLVLVAGNSPSERAASFLAEFGAILLDEPDRLRERETREDRYGSTVIYDVIQNSLRVYGAEVRVRIGVDGMVRYAGGSFPLDYDDLGPARVSAEEARSLARAASPRTFVASEPTLVVFNPGLFYGMRTPSHLAYYVDVLGRGAEGGEERVFADATHAYAIVGLPLAPTDRERLVYSFKGVPEDGAFSDANPMYDEDGPVVSDPTPDSTRAFDIAGDVYDFLHDRFERDGVDGEGAAIRIYTDQAASQTAYWSRIHQCAVFPPDRAGRDVVAHELGHGVVQHTAGLEYWMESGALNESIADTFGSFLDGAAPYAIGNEVPDGPYRSMADPLEHEQPHHVSLAYMPPVLGSCSHPRDCGFEQRCVGGQCMIAGPLSDHGGVHVNSGIPNHAIYLMREGGTHTLSGISVGSVASEKVAQVVYGALAYLGPASGFTDYRVAARQASLELIGRDLMSFDECGSVLTAFAAVGIGPEDSDRDCFDDEVDNCPCVHNPEQLPEDCEGERACLEPECESDADCAGTCSDSGYCVEFTDPGWSCNGPGDCPPGVHCTAQRRCIDPCRTDLGALVCEGCIAQAGCGWCDGGCRTSTRTCADGDTPELVCGDPCDSATTCGTCNEITGCGWCPGQGCLINFLATTCSEWRDSQSQCSDCNAEGYDRCETCAADGYCSWCPGRGCVNDSLVMCPDKRSVPSQCG